MDPSKLEDNGSTKLSSKLGESAFVCSYADYSTYRKGAIFMALPVYFDDIELTSNDTEACKQFKAYLNTCFSIKDLGPLQYFLVY